VTVGRWVRDALQDPPLTPVAHRDAVLAFHVTGRARVEVREAWELRPGDCLIVPAGEPHRTLRAEPSEFWGLRFCVPCFAGEGTPELLEPFERVRDGASAVVRIPEARRAHLIGLFAELERVTQDRGMPGSALGAVQRSLLTLILAEVGSAYAWQDRVHPRGGVVTAALRFIERNCLRPLTLGEVAAVVGRSPAYVTTALTRATGRSAVQWIVAGRMAQARRLLLHSDVAVEVVAERVGYADVTHFIRMFRREHGATPAAWRSAQALG